MNGDILALPWQIQVALASGYAAYSIAYVGIRSHHTATDTIFRALIFSTLATFSLSQFPIEQPEILVLISVIVTLSAGFLWRYLGRLTLKRFLRDSDLSWTDDTPTAWKTITAENSSHLVSQVAVELNDGTWLICSSLARFKDSPFAPCTFGLDGDIAIYVDEEVDPDGTEIKNETVIDDHFGDRMTYIPASSVKRVSIRYLRSNRG